jgi:glutamate-ammonia-ligase adenylyltransferase
VTDQRSDADQRLAFLGYDRATLDAIKSAVGASPDPLEGLDRLIPILEVAPEFARDAGKLERVVAISSSSRALSQALAANPELLDTAPTDSIPLQVRASLIQIAAADLTGRIDFAEATRRYSDALDRIVDDALDRARHAVSDRHPIAAELPFSVIAMGKWGARELNYYSDIDLVFVHDDPGGRDSEARSASLAIASRLMSILSAPTFDGPALVVDADLRPEGTMGPLSRSLSGYVSYYDRWSEPWELQALLKSRPAAGDPHLGRRFAEMAHRLVWEEGLDPDALRSIRKLKAQTELSAPQTDLKRSRGGIRDVEFAVQLLQMVHGRFDEDLRARSTLEAISSLTKHGYIHDDEGDRLADSYRFLRETEHRLQLWDLQQTHELPGSPEALERLARSLGFTVDPVVEFQTRLGEVRASARDLHERLYFRPILESLARLPSARLDREAARLRLEALGFTDVLGATKAFEELTKGLSRRSRVMHQMLPLMLDWLSRSPDPDLGLSQLRLVLARSPDHGALITLLQGNPLAGERLCLLLGTGRLLGDLIDRIPEFVPRLADEQMISEIRDLGDARERLISLLDSRPDPDAKIGTIRRFTRRRKLRIAARDILVEPPPQETLSNLSDSADAAIAGALHVLDPGASIQFGVVAMGKWGGRELSYGSDIDLLYVYGAEEDRERSLELASGLGRVLAEPSRHGEAYQLDADLRPEGRSGPLARSLDGFRRYYEEWVEPWEILALVKARPAAGNDQVLAAFQALIEPVVWKEEFAESMARSIRQVKARVESERIPAGEDPDFHLKLGPGGLSDVEFVTQLLQLQHGGREPLVRVTGTLEALRALLEAGVLTQADHDVLSNSYIFCTRARMRLHLQRGRVSDSLPTDPAASTRLAVSLGFGRTTDLREEYRRHTRKARRVFERLFFE